MDVPPFLDLDALRALARSTAAVDRACACVRPPPSSWTSMPRALPQATMREIGTLVAAPLHELTVAEYHPNGTHVWSDDAPIAPAFYPYNQSTVWRCNDCGRCFLHYTEGGGYYLDRRIRLLDPALIVEVAAPASGLE